MAALTNNCSARYVPAPLSSPVSSNDDHKSSEGFKFDHIGLWSKRFNPIVYENSDLDQIDWKALIKCPEVEGDLAKYAENVCNDLCAAVEHIQKQMLSLYAQLHTVVEESLCHSTEAVRRDWIHLQAIYKNLSDSDTYVYGYMGQLIEKDLQHNGEPLLQISDKASKTVEKINKCCTLFDYIREGVIFSESGEVLRFTWMFPFIRTDIGPVKSYSLKNLSSMNFDEFSAVWERMSWCGKAL